MSVNLRGPDVLVAEKLLDGPEIPAGLQGVSGKGVPEHVGGNSLLETNLLAGVPDWMAEVANLATTDAGWKDQGAGILILVRER